MKATILFIIVILSWHISNSQIIYHHSNFAVHSNIALYPDSTFRQSNTGCESEFINKGCYHISNDTLYLNAYSTWDSIFPKIEYTFTPDSIKSVRIQILDEDHKPWSGFSIMTGDTTSKRQYYFTDSLGYFIHQDTLAHRFIILNFLEGSLNFSDTNTHNYFWDSKTYGTYTVTIKEKQFFALDRNTYIKQGLKIFLIIKDGKLYEGENLEFIYTKQDP